jgi:uncharacterized membrane protein YfhO
LNYLKIKTKLNYFVLLSISLWMVILSIYLWWVVADKAIVEFWDGQSQHFLSFVYFGEYAREVLKNIVINHDFKLPLYDFSIGYGQDILGTLHYYIIGDPFSILSVITKPKYAENVFAFAIMLRLFLSGISFSTFALSKKFSYFQSFIGTFVYVFSGYAISAASRHPYFINPMIYLPLLCIGVDHILEKKENKLFIFMTFIAVISNFYFFYILTLLVFIYAVYRYLNLYSIKEVKQLFLLLLQSIGSYLIGILMGAMIFIPVVYQFMNTGRGSEKPIIELLYSKDFYLSFIKNFISPVYSGNSWTITAYLPIVMLTFACILYHLGNKKSSAKRDFITVLILTLFLFFPYIGSFFNGLSYSTNRWIFGYTFFMAFLTTKYLPNIIATMDTLKERKQLLKIGGITLVLSIIFMLSNYNRAVQPFVGTIFLLLYLVVVLLPLSTKSSKLSLAVLTLLNALVYGAFQSNIKINPGIFNSYTDANIVQNDYRAYKSSAIKDIQDEDKSWFRYELSRENYRAELNNALIRKTHSTNFYFSLSNENIFTFNKRLGNIIPSDFEYYGLDSRAELGTLANSKYYAQEATTSTQFVPYGYTFFKSVKKGPKEINIYKNSNFLPFGYTYDSYTKSGNQTTAPLTLMNSMPKEAILEKDVPGLKSTSFNDEDIKKLDYDVANTNGVKIDNNQYIVTIPNGEITLKFKDNIKDFANSYLYLNIQGINYPNVKHGIFGLSATMNETSLRAAYDSLQKDFTYRSKYQGWYVGIDDVLMNLGPVTNTNEVKLTFKNPGNYQFNSLDLYARNYRHLSTDIAKLRENTLKNVHFGTNSVSGKIDLDKEKLLLLSIPYDKGWTAYDNGKKIPIIKANFMYSGLVLKKGDHHIQLKYKTPGANIGVLLTIVGWSLFIILIYRDKHIKRSIS